MTRSKRMQSIVNIASNEEEVAAKGLADAINNLDRQGAALQELISFREDYSVKFHQTVNTSAMAIQQFHDFISQLNQGIEHQQKILLQAEEAIEEQRQLWIERHNRTRALNKVVENYVRQEHESDEKLEQKLLDEYAMRSGIKQRHS
ncbi:hypothetical protein MNBD_GAMMA12-3040 [hydrothermal vent metagenome]|uniref:Flagellar FliJ protein n=1 Tax=hydrothermal vent metagenome TaxID=652676 RepID=A0A3B0Y6P6_9ZZZZ